MDTITSLYLGCTEHELGTLTCFLKVAIYIRAYPWLAFIQKYLSAHRVLSMGHRKVL